MAFQNILSLSGIYQKQSLQSQALYVTVICTILKVDFMPVDSEGKEVAPSLHYSTRHVVIHRRTSPQRYTTLVLIHQSNKVDFSKMSMSSRNLSYKRKIMLTAFYLKELQMGL